MKFHQLYIWDEALEHGIRGTKLMQQLLMLYPNLCLGTDFVLTVKTASQYHVQSYPQQLVSQHLTGFDLNIIMLPSSNFLSPVLVFFFFFFFFLLLFSSYFLIPVYSFVGGHTCRYTLYALYILKRAMNILWHWLNILACVPSLTGSILGFMGYFT